MPHYVTIRRVAAVGTALLLAVAVSVASLFLISTPGARGDGHLDWPRFTMVYEVDGLTWNGRTVKEIHRLDYTSRSDWLDTTIGSDALESLAVSHVDPAGSYQQVRDGQWQRHTSFNGAVNTAEVSEGTIRVPNAYLVPVPVAGIKQSEDEDQVNLVPTSTESTVCYQAECKANAGGLWLEAPGWVGRKLVDDPRWGIALEFQDRFKVHSLDIDADPPASGE